MTYTYMSLRPSEDFCCEKETVTSEYVIFAISPAEEPCDIPDTSVACRTTQFTLLEKDHLTRIVLY